MQYTEIPARINVINWNNETSRKSPTRKTTNHKRNIPNAVMPAPTRKHIMLVPKPGFSAFFPSTHICESFVHGFVTLSAMFLFLSRTYC